MNIKPVASKHEIGANIKTTSNTNARDRALSILTGNAQAKQEHTPDLSALMGNQQAQQVVANQNNIAPEEMSAIAPQAVDNLDTQTSSEPKEVTEAPAEEPKQDPVLSRQFAQLARQEKALRAKQQQQDQALRQRESDLKAREDAIAAKDQSYKSDYLSKADIKRNALRALAESGVSYDEVTQQILSQSNTDPRVESLISELKAEIQDLKSGMTKRDQTYADDQKTSYENAKRQILSDTKSLVAQDPEFETIKATNSYNDVVELIEETYKKDGILMTVEEAAKEVEDYLVNEAIKITQISKIKSKLQASTAARTEKEKTQQSQAATPMKTLTNATSASRPMSARERALAAFKGQKIG